MNDFNRQNDEFWRWGIIYFNPIDPAIKEFQFAPYPGLIRNQEAF